MSSAEFIYLPPECRAFNARVCRKQNHPLAILRRHVLLAVVLFFFSFLVKLKAAWRTHGGSVRIRISEFSGISEILQFDSFSFIFLDFSQKLLLRLIEYICLLCRRKDTQRMQIVINSYIFSRITPITLIDIELINNIVYPSVMN